MLARLSQRFTLKFVLTAIAFSIIATATAHAYPRQWESEDEDYNDVPGGNDGPYDGGGLGGDYYGDTWFGGGFYGDEYDQRRDCVIHCIPWTIEADDESSGSESGPGSDDWGGSGSAIPEVISDIARIEYDFYDFDSFMEVFNELPINEQYGLLAQGFYAEGVNQLAQGNVDAANGLFGLAESYLGSLNATGADTSSYDAMQHDIDSFRAQGFESMNLTYLDSQNDAIAVVGGIYHNDDSGHLVFTSISVVDAIVRDAIRGDDSEPCSVSGGDPFCASSP